MRKAIFSFQDNSICKVSGFLIDQTSLLEDGTNEKEQAFKIKIVKDEYPGSG